MIVFSNYDSLSNPYYSGGGARAIHEVGLRLARYHKVQVLCGQFHGSNDNEIDGVSYKYIGSKLFGPKLGQFAFCIALLKWIKHINFDIWIESMTPPFSLMQLPLYTRRPVCFLTQVWVGDAMWKKYHIPIYLYEKVALKVYKLGITTSKFLKEQFQRINPNCEIVVIPNGVRKHWLSQEPSDKKNHILYAGRIDIQQKGLDILLKAISIVRDKLHYKLQIVGKGTASEEKLLKNQIKRMNLANYVVWIKHATEEQLAEAFRQAIVFILPSRYEASPLVIPEAFAFGVPVIMSDIPELAEYPQDACLKFKACCPEELASAIVRLTLDKNLLAQMSKAAKQQAAKYDWDIIVNSYLEILEKWFSYSKP